MRKIFGALFCVLGKAILSLRYKITVKGLENLNKQNLNRKNGILFLPNHPAHIDPILVSLILFPKFRLRPLVVEYIYRQRGINLIMRMMRAIPIPNFDTSMNEVKLAKAKNGIEQVIDGLKKNENFLIYPSGRLKHSGKEILGGSSGAHTILSEANDINVVLIRTTGLWGSSFSRAYTGHSPDFKATVWMNIKNVLKGLIFFLPRRKVRIEIEIAKDDFPEHGTRMEMNKYLEKWYNQYPVDGKRVEEEPLNLVSYSPFKKKFLRLPQQSMKKSSQKEELGRSKIADEVIKEIAKISRQQEEKIQKGMDLSADLGLDSLDMAELITFLGVNYEVGDLHPEDLITVSDAVAIAEGVKKVEHRPPQEQLLNVWPKEGKRPPIQLKESKTVQEAFLHSCKRMKGHLACGDDMIGILSYKKLKIAALLLSQSIKEYPGKYIGIMLPASVAAHLVILATMLAGKIPVMLNWTLGPRSLNSMLGTASVSCVISSWKFLERLSNVEFGKVIKKLHLLEDIKKNISKAQKIKTVLLSLKSTKKILRKLELDKIPENDPAVILFTSGTEAEPKGVPLSHKNILSNQAASLQCANLHENDTFMGILPPFHSFGFSVAGLLPILAGMKVAFYPDPTDSHAVVESVKRWLATIICVAPSFLKGILSAAKKDELKTIRLFVTGAEKAPAYLFDQIKKMGGNKNLIEGYGITECSPVITINRPDRPAKGVGQPIPNVELCVIDPETDALLGIDKEGEICVSGPNVFHGYLGIKKSPFVEIKQKRWYRTGDLGRIDKEGFLTLSGRIKRFTKIGAEIVSLAAIEEVILDEMHRRQITHEEGPALAVCAKELEGGKPILTVFSVLDLDVKDVNQMLKEAGFSRLVKVQDIHKMDEIPLMGTGKVDYRYLQNML